MSVLNKLNNMLDEAKDIYSRSSTEELISYFKGKDDSYALKRLRAAYKKRSKMTSPPLNIKNAIEHFEKKVNGPPTTPKKDPDAEIGKHNKHYRGTHAMLHDAIVHGHYSDDPEHQGKTSFISNEIDGERFKGNWRENPERRKAMLKALKEKQKKAQAVLDDINYSIRRLEKGD